MDRGGTIKGGNQLLDALGTAELLPRVSTVFLEAETVLFEAGGAIDHVDFPRNCVVSLVTPLQNDATAEVATVGSDGIVGVPLQRGGALTFRAVCSVAGWADRMDASTFLNAVQHCRALRDLVDDYVQALFGQISQAAACNRLHSDEARLSRWLLMSHDRVGSDDFAVTHQHLAGMLGSHRPIVRLSAGILQAAGLIMYSCERFTIADRLGLEATACECYRTIERDLAGVVQRALGRSSGRAGTEVTLGLPA